MSFKNYKPATAKETAAQKKAKKDWDKMTPAQRKRATQASTPATAPKKKITTAATKAIRKLVKAKKTQAKKKTKK